MALFGKVDQASSSPISTAGGFNKAPNTANRTNIFGNTTTGSFVTNQKVGVFGISTSEIAISNGAVISYEVLTPGSGYHANATVTVGGNATANATANSTGRISAVNIVLAGNSYSSSPTVTVSAPAGQSFNANTGVAANGFVTIASNKFQVGDRARYLVAASNTAVVGLSNNTNYWVQASNSTGVYLSSTKTGAAITLTPSATSETGHTLTGETATARATISGTKNKGPAHAGWNLRREGTGGRSGRVHYETLVAMGSMTGDASDDTVIKDS